MAPGGSARRHIWWNSAVPRGSPGGLAAEEGPEEDEARNAERREADPRAVARRDVVRDGAARRVAVHEHPPEVGRLGEPQFGVGGGGGGGLGAEPGEDGVGVVEGRGEAVLGVLEPSSQAQLGTRTPAMPGDQDAREHGGTNERGNEHQNIRCNGAQPFRLLSSIIMQCMDACPDSRPSPAPCRTPSATPFLRDVRCVPQCPPWRSRTPNDPGDVVTKHASGHASPLA